MIRTIAIVGTINYDRIVTREAAPYEDLGGILYNVLSLAPFVPPDVRLIPVAKVGEEQRERIGALFSPHPHVDGSRILFSREGTNETVLRYTSPDEREETLIERVTPFTWEEIEASTQADYLLVNLIWGRELTADLLGRLCGAIRGVAVLDIQSLPLTFRAAPDRTYRNISDWRAWVAGAHTVKGNEQEIRWFLGTDGEPDAGDLRALLGRILEVGPSVVIATRGRDGHAVAWKDGSRRRWASVPPVRIPRVERVDSTGCGDAFTSGYLVGLLRGEDPVSASFLGASLASLACRCRGLEALRSLPDPGQVREKAYGDLHGRIRDAWSRLA